MKLAVWDCPLKLTPQDLSLKLSITVDIDTSIPLCTFAGLLQLTVYAVAKILQNSVECKPL